jgi:hypothetical protein
VKNGAAMTERIAQLIDEYRHARDSLAFLDCNLWLGRPPNPEFVTDFSLDALRKRMARYSIQGGVVTHFASLTYGQIWGNDAVLRALDGTGLWSGIVLVPQMFDPEPKGRAYLSDAVARGARVARIYPTEHRFSVADWCAGALLQALADSRMPLMVRHTQISWDEIHRICEARPNLTVIVEAVEQKILYHNRRLYPLLEHHPNLRLELHNFVGYLAVEDVVRRFGAHHLVFGSYMPVADPNAPMMLLTHARTPLEEKRRIARDNLAELVEAVRQL